MCVCVCTWCRWLHCRLLSRRKVKSRRRRRARRAQPPPPAARRQPAKLPRSTNNRSHTRLQKKGCRQRERPRSWEGACAILSKKKSRAQSSPAARGAAPRAGASVVITILSLSYFFLPPPCCFSFCTTSMNVPVTSLRCGGSELGDEREEVHDVRLASRTANTTRTTHTTHCTPTPPPQKKTLLNQTKTHGCSLTLTS